MIRFWHSQESREDAAFEHGYKLGRQGAGIEYARWAEHIRRHQGQAALDAEEQRHRDMARQAFRAAAGSGHSPGTAGLLAELERGWERRDRKENRS